MLDVNESCLKVFHSQLWLLLRFSTFMSASKIFFCGISGLLAKSELKGEEGGFGEARG